MNFNCFHNKSLKEFQENKVKLKLRIEIPRSYAPVNFRQPTSRGAWIVKDKYTNKIIPLKVKKIDQFQLVKILGTKKNEENGNRIEVAQLVWSTKQYFNNKSDEENLTKYEESQKKAQKLSEVNN